MRILFLSQRFLYPMDTGGKIRTGKILEQLCKVHDVTVVGNFEPGTDEQFRMRMENLCSRYKPVVWTEPRRGSLAFYLRLALHSLSRYPVTALNDYSPALETALVETIDEEDFDLAICDFVQSALLFRRVSGIPRMLFQHNVEARIFERHVENAGNLLSRAFWSSQHRRMKHFEAAAVRNFDSVVAVSENDGAVFQNEYGAANVYAIPTGVDIDFYSSDNLESPDNSKIVFCGSMDWLPNEDGIRYFLTEIAPELSRLIESWSLTVVGRNPSEWLKRVAGEDDRVSVTGWVDDVRPYLAGAALCIVPLRIGGGTRMKIYEAMAMSMSVVSTSVGAEGLDIENGKNIWIVDDPVEFAAKTAESLGNRTARTQMGASARTLVEENFSWNRVAQRFADICSATVDAYEPGVSSS